MERDRYMKSMSLAYVAMLIVCFVVAPACAATLTVTSLADNGTSGTLRVAINAANANPGSDSNVPARPYRNDKPIANRATHNCLPHNDPWAGRCTAGEVGRPVHLPDRLTSDCVLAIPGLTVQNGNDDVDGKGGGGFLVDGNRPLTNCALVGNSSSNYGGGILNGGGTVSIIELGIFVRKRREWPYAVPEYKRRRGWDFKPGHTNSHELCAVRQHRLRCGHRRRNPKQIRHSHAYCVFDFKQ